MNEKKWLSMYPESISKEIMVPDFPMHKILQNACQSYPDNTAITFYNQKITYQELFLASQAFASSLQKKGVKKGDRAAIMLPNCPQYVIAYYGCLTAGAIITQINPMLVERELQHILQDSGAETIVVLDGLYPKVKTVQRHTSLKNIIAVSLQPSQAAFSPDTSFDAFMETGDGSIEPVLIDPEHDIAVLQYTGGTTGRSKGAMLTHRNILANVVQCYEFFKHELKVGSQRTLSIIPLFHVFGMTSAMNLSIYIAGDSIMLPRFEIDEVLETIKREQPTTFPGVPTMYVALTNHPKAEEYGMGSISLCNSGSAPMPVELLREFERKSGAMILEGYGLTEASPTTHCNPAFAQRKPGSVGIGVPSTEYKVMDLGDGTKEVAPGEMGELVVKGPQVMKGYWNMPEETAVTLRDGWLYTGDIAKVDEEGYLYIVDRKKDLIIASGYNIYPRDVEEVLYEHPAVREAVVIGVPDAYRGESVKAVLVLKDGKMASDREIIDYCRANLAAYKVPHYVEFREELPKTNVGKILRRALREELSNK
ncbi:long-chain fatty acid--CoA ligase [Peribacillus sp. SI8-4]|uniref:long-chain-fatty-acid--CoA ligase n=1 Tax=Peribacillus sp. SI8-4 TaxID=3048009 RepID=UPI002557B924|nr:long-chain fatty acid--CoA ligase [Peribacillus sp. SI8-4]